MTARASAFANLANIHEHMLIGNINHFLLLQEGHFVAVWWNIGHGRAEVLLARGASYCCLLVVDLKLILVLGLVTLVVTMYSKAAGSGAKHEWLESSHTLGTLSYVTVQVFARMFGLTYSSIACSTLSCETFAHIPSTHVILALGTLEGGVVSREVIAQDGTEWTEATVSPAVQDLLAELDGCKRFVDAGVRELCSQLKRKNPTGNLEILAVEDSESEEPEDTLDASDDE